PETQAPAVAAPQQDTSGRLRPAKRSGDSQDGRIRFEMGGNEFRFTPKNGRVVPITLKGQPLIWVDYDKKSGAALSGDFYRDDGRLVAEIRSNKFQMNENSVLSIKPRTNEHSLTVLDDLGQVVLFVEFLDE